MRRIPVLACILTLALAGVGRASVCTVGPTQFLELDANANAGFDNLAGSSFDWANGGANATPRSCTAIGNGVVQSCTGSGGIFNDANGCNSAGDPAACCTGAGTGT